MKRIILLAAVASMTTANASYDQAPPSFSYKSDKAVFVDFHNADYEITYDVANKTTEVTATIEFSSKEEGFPIFDLVAEPSEVTLDGAPVTTEVTPDPDKQTTLRVIQAVTAPGEHTLTIKHKISTNVVYGEEGVASGFWMSDLNDRRYLEQYLATNLEFDQYKMDMKVDILDSRPHLFKANGAVTKLAENSFVVSFPEFYSASSVYFHLFPEKNNTTGVQFYYESIDGRLIPVDIYTIYNPADFAAATRSILAELERDYGPWPHDQLIIYGNAPSGGMEHSGATITSLKALGHELFHSYHARGLMPANGNAGWMDEAIARWRDNNYPLVEKLNYESTRLAGRSIWSRMTDRMAYTEGSAFLGWVAHRMNAKGLSFKMFLRNYFQEYKYTTVTTELFKSELIEASGMDLEADFAKYIYGKGAMSVMPPSHKHVENEFHPVYTKKQLLEMTMP